MRHINCPIIGDPVYGRRKIVPSLPPAINNFRRQALHSATLRFIHPLTNVELTFESQLPDDMHDLLLTIKGDASSGLS
jgi:23S rRNA pseudouridine1911/1915/1917 synthase